MRSFRWAWAGLLVLCCACSGPRDTKVPADIEAWKTNSELQQAVQKLSPEEKQLFLAWSMRSGLGAAFGAPIPEGITLGQAIEAQRTWAAELAAKEVEKKALAERMQAERKAALAAMSGVVTAALMTIEFEESDFRRRVYRSKFHLKFAFQNNTSKALAGIKGAARFSDIFGDEITTINLSIDDAIPANGAIAWDGTTDYNQFRASDAKLRNTSKDKINFEWIPQAYLFADGTRMDVPEAAAAEPLFGLRP